MEIEICKKQWERSHSVCGFPQCPFYKNDSDIYKCSNGFHIVTGTICPGYWGRNPLGK